MFLNTFPTPIFTFHMVKNKILSYSGTKNTKLKAFFLNFVASIKTCDIMLLVALSWYSFCPRQNGPTLSSARWISASTPFPHDSVDISSSFVCSFWKAATLQDPIQMPYGFSLIATVHLIYSQFSKLLYSLSLKVEALRSFAFHIPCILATFKGL